MTGLTAAEIGDGRPRDGIALHELTPQQASLEEAFMDADPGGRRVPDARRAGAREAGRVSRITTTPHRPAPHPRPRHAGAAVLLSEWTKLRSVRSTRWSLLAAFVFTIGIAALACAVVRTTGRT